jgi:alkylmercury lyase-like protein
VSTIDSVSLRVFVYDELLARGAPPSSGEIGAHFGTTPDEARRALADLKIGKTILVDPQSGEIWMAGPFAARPTSYHVVSGERSWWANCAWDMFGVAMIANERARVHTRCTDCSTPMTIVADPAAAPNDDAVVHFLLPARQWYDDIGFT